MSNPSTDRSAISQIIDGLFADDWTLVEVDDRGDENVPTPTKPEALDAVMAVEDAYLHVEHTGNSDTGWVRFVMGNEPYEVAADYSVNLATAIEAVTDRWEQ